MTLQSLMVESQFFKPQVVKPKNYVPTYIEDFLNFYADEELDLINGYRLKANLNRSNGRTKINPILQLAKPDEAHIIVGLFKEAYNGTYPYKEFEDKNELRRMLEEGNLNFVLLKNEEGEIYGCVKFLLELEQRRGYLGGTVVWKKYLGQIDVAKAYIGTNLYFMRKYQDELQVVYGEARTAHAKVQYFCELCGILPAAILANKDVFLGRVESDLFVYAIQKKTLNGYRPKQSPHLIPEAVNCFIYASDCYKLSLPIQINNPDINLDLEKVMSLQAQLEVNIQKDKFGYHFVHFGFKGNDNSFFKFLYTPMVQNFEKVEYGVQDLEELVAFFAQLKTLATQLKIRYIEVFVSAFEPEHQKLFYEVGLRPRGYIPSWKYNGANDTFEDHILFNYYEGEIAHDIDFIQKGWDLFGLLKLN